MGASYEKALERGHGLRKEGLELGGSRIPCHYEMVTRSDITDTFRKSRVASVAEWHASGLTRARFRSMVRSGDLVRVWHGVYATKTAIGWAKASPARGHALLAAGRPYRAWQG
jgi:hypothetical protein